MRIDDYEFEEEKTLQSLGDLLEKIAEQIKSADTLELPMPTLKEGVITLPLNEPVETSIEIAFRKKYIHLKIDLSWERPVIPEVVEE